MASSLSGHTIRQVLLHMVSIHIGRECTSTPVGAPTTLNLSVEGEGRKPQRDRNEAQEKRCQNDGRSTSLSEPLRRHRKGQGSCIGDRRLSEDPSRPSQRFFVSWQLWTRPLWQLDAGYHVHGDDDGLSHPGGRARVPSVFMAWCL